MRDAGEVNLWFQREVLVVGATGEMQRALLCVNL